MIRSPFLLSRPHIFHVIRGNIPLHQFLHGFQPGAPISGRFLPKVPSWVPSSISGESTILNHTQPSSTILNHTQPLWNFFDLWIFMDIKLVKWLKIIGNSKITSIIHISLHFSNFFGRATRPLVHQIRPVFDACSMTNGVPHIIYTYIYIHMYIWYIYDLYYSISMY